MELTDKQWMRIEPVIVQSIPKKDSRSRKQRDLCEVLNNILWVLCAAAPDLPPTIPAMGGGWEELATDVWRYKRRWKIERFFA